MEHNPALDAALTNFLLHSKEYALLVLDAHGNVVKWMGAAQELFGYTAEEIVGKSGSVIFIAPDRQKGFDELEMAIARERGRSEDDRWHARKDGTKIWVSGSMEAVREGAGTMLGFVKVLRDRTDLRLHVETLESRLASSEAATQRTRDFLRTLGHEMRNPLATCANEPGRLLPTLCARAKRACFGGTRRAGLSCMVTAVQAGVPLGPFLE